MPSKLIVVMFGIIAYLFTLADFLTEGIHSKILDFYQKNNQLSSKIKHQLIKAFSPVPIVDLSAILKPNF